jgi:hypothetical protein
VHGLVRELPEWRRKFELIAEKHVDFVVVKASQLA